MKQNHMTKGVVLMVFSSVVFCAMSMLIKCVPGIDSFKTSLFRIGMAVLGTAAIFGFMQLRFVNGRLLFLRGLFGGLGVFLFFLSIAKLGIAKGTVISYSYPIFASVLGMTLPVFNFLVGILVFHEPMPPRAVVGSIIVIASCMLIIMIENRSEPVIPKIR
ncbi:MAG: DMT family transporter [Verrucomicrobia bacterium]|nr:DMT family transporter [Verrucomicrobiota bacterium]MCG2681823.1 DMT family transporter [Kiritimatiellia bacterium]MBU4247705.1 DMT family transporter [Verrucomicrobiota bacterium]MBU4291644.1 DMT family transporter [Verrucomicrobiota bacterium]MBU4429539.1 DMT family transporter [Verrucomicrobiota bacterium]